MGLRILERPYRVDTPIGSAVSRRVYSSVDQARANGYILYYQSPTVYVMIRPGVGDSRRWAFVFRSIDFSG